MVRTALSIVLAHLICIFCFVLMAYGKLIFAETWTPCSDKNYQYHITIVPKGSLWGLTQKHNFHKRSILSLESLHQRYHRSGLKVLLWLCLTWNDILSKMNLSISFISMLTQIPDGCCNCFDLSSRKWIPISILLNVIDNLSLA